MSRVTRGVLETFLELVRIDSPSGEEAAVGEYCARVLRRAGLAVRFDDAAGAAGAQCGNLIAEMPGDADGLRLVMCGHLDTVEPGRGIEPVVADGVVRSAGETILGADDKSGLAAIIECVRRLRESGESHGPIKVVFTVSEEMGLAGAKQLSPRDADGDLCLVLDADGKPGGIVTAAPTHHTFRATFKGRSAHAGVEPEKGRSALVMASEAVSSMALGRLDDETTANIGTISGGVRTNVVASEARVTGECRSLDDARADAVRDEMTRAMETAAARHEGTVDVVWTREYGAFSFREDDPLVALVEGACEDCGLVSRRFPTGGGSDGNILSEKGVPTLVLACGMSDVHGMSETLKVAHLDEMVALLLAIVRRARS